MKHPTDDELAAFVERRSIHPEKIEEHIDECADCRVAVAHLAALAFGERSGDRTAPPIALAIGPQGIVPPGEKIARYVVRREIGRGAMGVVVAAYDPELDREVALKVVRPSGDRENVLREARTMARFAHPNVVTIHDVGDLGDGRVFLAMELVRGSTLRAFLRDRKPARAARAAEEREMLLDLFVQAGRGLAAAHAAGIVHRDFKPDNVLVGDDGRVRVTDFGLATAANDAATAGVAGTPIYMAPEQHRGKPATPQSDQFAFAVALYEALAGKRPFGGTTYAELARAKNEGAILSWSQTTHFVPDRLRDAIQRALAVDPAARPASIEELVAVLAAPPPKRWTLVVAAVAVAILVWVGFAATKREMPRAATPPACTPTAVSFTRSTLENSLSGQGRSSEAIAKVLGVLEQQAHAITSASEVACKTAPPARAATEACLERRVAEIEGVSGALPGIKGSLDDVLVLEPLGSIAACTPSSVAPLPEEPEKRRLVLDVYRDIAGARADRWGMHGVLDGIAKRADASGHAPAGGELALARAEIDSKTASFEEAIAIAQASRDDDLAARAWRARVRSDAKRGDSDLAAHASLAIGAIDRVGRPDWKADVLDWRARDDFEEARFRAAHEALDQAKRLRAIVPTSSTERERRPAFEDDLLRIVCLLEEERNDDAKAALYRVEQSVGADPPLEVRARVLALSGRIALVFGKIDEALALFARAQETALEEQKRYAADKADGGGIASSAAHTRRHAARHGFIEAALWQGKAQLAQNRLDLAEKSFESVVVEARSAGVNIEPLAEVRAIAELARIQRVTGKRDAERKKTPLGRATRSITFLEGRGSPLVGEALLAQAEAFVAEGKLQAAVPILTRAEKLTVDGSPETHADCIILLHRAAKASNDPAATTTAESAARLASVSALFGPQTPTRKKLAAEFSF